MKRKYAILAALSVGCTFFLGTCISDLLFVIAPFLL